MARSRRTPTRSRSSRQSTSAQLRDSLRLPPHVARSLFGLALLVIGAVTLIALLFPQAGVLNRYVADVLRPLFGQGAWLLGVLLLVAGVTVERPGSVGYGSSLAIVGSVLAFVAGLGLIHLVWGHGGGNQALRAGGGALGNALSLGLSDLISPIGAFVVLLGLLIGGALLLFNITLRTLLRPVTGGGRMLAKAMATPARALAEGASARRAEAVANPRAAIQSQPRPRLNGGATDRAGADRAAAQPDDLERPAERQAAGRGRAAAPLGRVA